MTARRTTSQSVAIVVDVPAPRQRFERNYEGRAARALAKLAEVGAAGQCRRAKSGDTIGADHQ